MSRLSSMVVATQGIFGADDGASLAPVVTPDTDATVIVNTPDTNVPTPGEIIPPENQDDDNSDIVLIDDPDNAEDSDDIIDADDDDGSADLSDCVDQMQATTARTGVCLDAIDAIAMHGVDPLTIGMLQRSGLLAQTALGTMSAEAFTDGFAGSHDATMSSEALADAAAEMVAKKATGAASEAAGKAAGSLFEKITTKLVSMGDVLKKAVSLSEKSAVDALEHAEGAVAEGAAKAAPTAAAAAGTAKDTIKAGVEKATSKVAGKLTAKNAGLALAAAASVAVGLKMILSSVPAPNATVEAKNGFFSKVVSWVKGIKLPWAKLDVSDAGKLTCNGQEVKSATAAAEQAAAKASTSGAAGWTKSAIDSAKAGVAGLSDKVGGAFSTVSTKFHGLMGAGDTAGKAATDAVAARGGSATMAKAAGIFAHGSYVAGVLTILALIASVIYFVVVGGLRLVRKSAQGA